VTGLSHAYVRDWQRTTLALECKKHHGGLSLHRRAALGADLVDGARLILSNTVVRKDTAAEQ
jgi:hypothetical protein